MLKNCNSVYVCFYRDRALSKAFMCMLWMTVSMRRERRKGTPLGKRTNKDNFRCLITIWSIGITRRGLNQLIFVKTSNSNKIDIFHFFAFSSKLAPVRSNSFCQHGSHIVRKLIINLFFSVAFLHPFYVKITNFFFLSVQQAHNRTDHMQGYPRGSELNKIIILVRYFIMSHTVLYRCSFFMSSWPHIQRHIAWPSL